MKAKKLFPDISFRRLVRAAVPVDNLESTDTDRPLSANMGREVKELVDENTNSINELKETISNKANISYEYYISPNTTNTYQLDADKVYLVTTRNPYNEFFMAIVSTGTNRANTVTPIITSAYYRLSVSNNILTIETDSVAGSLVLLLL